MKVSRRTFVVTGVSAGAALVIGLYLPRREGSQPGSSPFNAWVHIDESGKPTLIVAKSEIGQGVRTSLPMILAEELEVDWATVQVQQADTLPQVYPKLGTGGSTSVYASYAELRRAGATAREMLITAAAMTWGTPRESCYAEQGAVIHRESRRQLSYGQLVKKASRLPMPPPDKVPLKRPAEFKLIGHSLPRVDIPSHVDGSAEFGLDVKVPGMLYAAVARCPVFGGKAARFDASQARAVRGVHAVFPIEALHGMHGLHTEGGIAVVAENTWSALQGRNALDIEWDHGANAGESSATLHQAFEAASRKPGKVVRNEGDAPVELMRAAQRVEAVYELPFLAHAPMEPMNVTVAVGRDGCEVWAPTQQPFWIQTAMARVTGVPESKVVVHTTLSGGAFGRRWMADVATEAAQIAKVVGKPVKLVWTREDDMRHDFYRPASHHHIAGACDPQGRIVAWHHHVVSTPMLCFWDPQESRPETSELEGASELPYAAANLRVEYTPVRSGAPLGWWRSVAHSSNTFVKESFVDELAHAAGADPMEFRLRLLDPPRLVPNPLWPGVIWSTARLKRVLELAADKAGWGKPVPRGHALGVACHASFGSYVAHVAEVSVGADRRPRVHRVVCAADCGLVIHPDGARAQMEGGVAFGLAAALSSKITIEGGAVQQSNFDDYEVLRLPDMPEVEVHFVPSEEAPTGLGEPGVPPIAPAVTNALFRLTGKRIRRLPIGDQLQV